MPQKYDVAVIGSGPGGYIAAIRAAQLGLKVVCIEKDHALGGTCLNVGCIPSKALLQSTENFAKVRDEGKEHGIQCQKLSFDFSQTMKRKKEIIQGLEKGISGLFQKNKVTHVQGYARLTSSNAVEVTLGKKKQTIEADNIILATGSEPIPLPFLPFDEKKVFSSTGALSLPEPPKKMVVIGAGAIGLELASVYCRLGTEVTVVEMLERVCPAMDAAVSKTLQQVLTQQGMTFHLATQVAEGKVEAKHVAITIAKDTQKTKLTADVVLVAIGRRPYAKELGLEEVGIELSKKGFVPINSTFQTNIPNIYAIGDLIEGPMLAHRASEEGTAVAEILSGLQPQLNYMAIPNVIYTSPEAAAVGFTEEEAKDAGLNIKVGTSFFRGNPRARCSGETDGFVKVLGEKRTDRLVGMHILGPHASEIIAEGVMAIESQMTLQQIASAPHAHPTLTETIKEAAQAIAD